MIKIAFKKRNFLQPARSFVHQNNDGPTSSPPNSTKIIQHNQVKAYKHDPKVNLVIRQSSPNEHINIAEKEKFQALIKRTA